jgi:hypothetical protein
MGKHVQHWLLVAAIVWAGPVAAQSCRLALSLGLDVSSSVDDREYALQSGGLAAALRNPSVVDAFLAEPGARVALEVFEWSGRRQQKSVIDWTWIGNADDLADVATALEASPRSFARHATALGNAMRFGAAQLAGRSECARRVLDLSGDGETNDGLSPIDAKRDLFFEQITINGLVIGVTRRILARHYETFVIHGPGAFVEEAADHSDFARAIRRKLIREVQPRAVSSLR